MTASRSSFFTVSILLMTSTAGPVQRLDPGDRLRFRLSDVGMGSTSSRTASTSATLS